MRNREGMISCFYLRFFWESVNYGEFHARTEM